MQVARAGLLVLVVGCTGDPEAWSRSSARVEAPSGSPWTAAQATIRFEPYRYGAHASRSEHIVLSLALEGTAAKTIELDDAYRGDEPGDTPKAQYEQLLAPQLELRFAPDGHALAVSIDGGSTFRVVLFDLGAPMFCHHASFAADALWTGVPASRAIALEVLASADPPIGETRLHLEPGEHPRGRERFVRELGVVRQWACARPDDAELRGALTAALLRPGRQIFATADYLPLAECVGALARDHAELRPQLVAALDAETIDPRMRAALALGQGTEPSVQQALAAALGRVPAACPEPPPAEQEVECRERRHLRSVLGWALGVVSSRRGTLPADALAAALALSRETDAAAQVFAIRTLALVDDPSARARIDELAAAPCTTAVPWRSEWLDPYEEAARAEDPACWAAAAKLSR